ncbi:MAG: hypothetical protein ACRDRL_15300 [Sciscionella sp.]
MTHLLVGAVRTGPRGPASSSIRGDSDVALFGSAGRSARSTNLRCRLDRESAGSVTALLRDSRLLT